VANRIHKVLEDTNAKLESSLRIWESQGGMITALTPKRTPPSWPLWPGSTARQDPAAQALVGKVGTSPVLLKANGSSSYLESQIELFNERIEEHRISSRRSGSAPDAGL
jgi:hypothetical protein